MECIPWWQYTSFKFGPEEGSSGSPHHLMVLWFTLGSTYLRYLLSQKQKSRTICGKNWESRIDIYTLLCVKLITSWKLLYNTAHPDTLWWPRVVSRGGRLKCVYTHIHIHLYTHTHIHLWLIHIIVCQKPMQHCKVIILQWGRKESDMTEHTHTLIHKFKKRTIQSWFAAKSILSPENYSLLIKVSKISACHFSLLRFWGWMSHNYRGNIYWYDTGSPLLSLSWDTHASKSMWEKRNC